MYCNATYLLSAHDSDYVVRRTVVFAYTSTETKVNRCITDVYPCISDCRAYTISKSQSTFTDRPHDKWIPREVAAAQ
jgi:hypothetical protein